MTFAVTGATALVLAAAGVLVYVQFGRTLDARTDAELRDRVEALLDARRARAARRSCCPTAGEPYAQVYDAAGGRLLRSTARLEEDRLLTPGRTSHAPRARRSTLEVERPAAAEPRRGRARGGR